MPATAAGTGTVLSAQETATEPPSSTACCGSSCCTPEAGEGNPITSDLYIQVELGAIPVAVARNRAILWLLYDTGIRVSELCGLRLADFDRRHGVITVRGKGSKERRVALGANCLRNLLYYQDRHRPNEEELAEWGSAGEDHVFLAETPPSMHAAMRRVVKPRIGITTRAPTEIATPARKLSGRERVIIPYTDVARTYTQSLAREKPTT